MLAGPRRQLSAHLAEHGLLLADEHVLGDRAVLGPASCREAEQRPLAQCPYHLGLSSGGVTKEKDVWLTAQSEEDRKRAR